MLIANSNGYFWECDSKGGKKRKRTKKRCLLSTEMGISRGEISRGGKKRKRTKNVSLLPTEMGISGGEILRGEKKRKRTKKN